LFGLNLYLHNSPLSDLKPQKSPLIDPFLVVIIKIVAREVTNWQDQIINLINVKKN